MNSHRTYRQKINAIPHSSLAEEHPQVSVLTALSSLASSDVRVCFPLFSLFYHLLNLTSSLSREKKRQKGRTCRRKRQSSGRLFLFLPRRGRSRRCIGRRRQGGAGSGDPCQHFRYFGNANRALCQGSLQAEETTPAFAGVARPTPHAELQRSERTLSPVLRLFGTRGQ